jgi:hypothetical protein
MATKKSTLDAAKKRSIARRFNDSLIGRSGHARREKTLDRRTVRRLDRYRRELKNGRKSGEKALTPLDIATRINELLNHGERLSDIRKLIKPRSVEYDEAALVAVLKKMHPIYEFRAEAYRFAGVKNEALVAAGVLETLPAKRGPKPRSGRKPRKKTAKKTRR